ncbi:6-phosphogluconolactonase [Allosaccharopolyspora coralli]|uniref:6-phosphogluconolactonase n=1 Tax=Allosaccharopolyspora coralli TaxID=2665642 RepID=A0A5Q3Q532_9PSEU|nr:6-phosphogluconolactonase [Allosaccharopolyspora coralli]QGK69731.1 6-phosphogluconolactonase [Allosaccharopolyspora coralli]
MSAEVVVHDGDDLLAAAAAARLLTRIVDAQAARGAASVVLTGGRTGTAVLEHVYRSPARDAVRWDALEVYWGDERFLPSGDPERNETQARKALLDHVPVDPGRVHPMPASDGVLGDDVDRAAAHYAELLAQRSESVTDFPVPTFDVVMLGVGEEGHTASLFPETPAVRESERSVVGVRDCPKPPPTRVSLTLPALRTGSEVWLLTTGEKKAEPVAAALSGADPVEVPVAGATGRTRTLWLLDSAAAARLH